MKTENHIPQISRIKVLTEAIRATWFAYLGVVSFVAVTLFGVEDSDFFLLDSTTQLPLIGITVPVYYFFSAGAMIVAAVYVYLHVSVESLWDAIGTAPARVEGLPLSKSLQPWLVNGMALNFRLWLRRENPEIYPNETVVDGSALKALGACATWLLLYLTAPVLLFGLWLRSMPAHDVWLTTGIAALFWLVLWVFAQSMFVMIGKLRRELVGPKNLSSLSRILTRRLAPLIILVLLLIVSSIRTQFGPSGESHDALTIHLPNENESFLVTQLDKFSANLVGWFRPVSADLSNLRITEFPDDWTNREAAVAVFYANWCDRPDTQDCGVSDKRPANFLREWRSFRKDYIKRLQKPNLSKSDLQYVDLSRSFFPGADFTDANLKHADFLQSVLEETNFDKAELQEADFSFANLIHSDFRFNNAMAINLEEADFRNSSFYSVEMPFARLTGADGRRSYFSAVDLSSSELNAANFENALIRYSNLDGVLLAPDGIPSNLDEIERANFRNARIEDSRLFGEADAPLAFLFSDIRGASFKVSGLRNAIFDFRLDQPSEKYSVVFDESTALESSFGDGSVILPPGLERPCHWAGPDEILDDKEFYGRWFGWLEFMEKNSSPFLPYLDREYATSIESIAPPIECTDSLLDK